MGEGMFCAYLFEFLGTDMKESPSTESEAGEGGCSWCGMEAGCEISSSIDRGEEGCRGLACGGNGFLRTESRDEEGGGEGGSVS